MVGERGEVLTRLGVLLSFWSGIEESLEELRSLFRFCADFVPVEDSASRSTWTPTSEVVFGSVPRVLSMTCSWSNSMLCSLTEMASKS